MQAVEEITREIDKQLQAATAKIDDFVAGQNASLSKAQQEHEAAMLEAERKLQRLKMDEATSQDKAGGLSEHLSADRKAFADKQSELARLQSQSAALPGDLDAAKSKEEAVKAQLSAVREEFEKKEKELRYQLVESAKAMSYYEKLGLAFEKKADNRLCVVFTQLDPADPQRRFTFCVLVTDADKYEVTECEPPVPALDALTEQLNSSNNFSTFVQLMRRAFKAVCMTGHGLR